MGATGSRSTGPVRLVHAGGHVEQYHRRVTVEEVMRRNPRHCVAKPEVFKYPSSSLLAPEVVLVPGDRLLLVPYRTVIKLYRRHGLVLPVLRVGARADAADSEKDVAVGCKPRCARGRHNSPAMRSSLGDAGGAIQPKDRGPGCPRKSRPGASRGRESPRAPRGSRTPTRKGGIYSIVRTPTHKNMGSRTPTMRTPTRKNPSQQAQFHTSASKSRTTRPSKRSKPSKESAGEKKSVQENALGGSKASQEVLDVMPSEKVVRKSICPNRVFPVRKGSDQSAEYAPEICGSSKAGSLLSEVNPEIVEAAAGAKSLGIALLDIKHSPVHGDSYANRSQDKQLERDKVCSEFDALVQRITNMAVLNAQPGNCRTKTGQSLLPIPTTVKEMIAMFEALHSESSNPRLDFVRHSTLHSDAASRGPHIDMYLGPESMVIGCIPVPPPTAPTSLQEKQPSQDRTRVPTDACQPRRASRTLQELIARADLHDNKDILQLDSDSAGRAVSCIVTSEGMQEKDSPGDGDRNEPAHEGVSTTSPNSMDSYMEKDLTQLASTSEGRATKDHNRDKGKDRRMKLKDHLKENVSPSNVVCRPKDCGHWEEPTTSVNTDKKSLEEDMRAPKYSTPMHPGEDKVRKIPKPPIKRTPGRRLPGSNRYRYRIRWYPRLSPVIEVCTEVCKVAHSVAP